MKDFHSERTEKSREFAHKLIDKFLGGELQMNELQEKLEKLKAEKWDNATIEEKVDMLRNEIRQIKENIELQESQKAQMSALNGMLNTIPLHHVLKY